MRFDILGTVEVYQGEEQIAVSRAQLRGLLGYLIVHANEHVSVVQLIDAIWGGAAPRTARAQVHTMVATLRRDFRDQGEPDRLVAGSSGYRLTVGPGELDADLFSELRVAAAEALERDDLRSADQHLVRALETWRGSALKDAAGVYTDLVRSELDEKRLLAQEELAMVWLAAGKHGELAAELPGLLALYPTRESLFRPYMLALYRCARIAEALDVGRALKQRLADEFGLDPSERTTDLISAMFRQDLALDWHQPGAVEASTWVPTGPPATSGDAAQAPPVTDPRGSSVKEWLPSPMPYRAPFFGRLRELAQIDAARVQATGRSRDALVALHGPPGGGKTALALSWASAHRDEFRDGVVYFDLDGVPSDEQGAQALASLGVAQDHRHLGADDCLRLYRSTLADAHVLLVLDGITSSDQARMLLPPSDRAMVMVLSGELLDGLLVREAAHPVEVGALEPADARALVRQTVVRGPELEDGADLARLVALCGHWPLALRSVAARLTAEPLLTVEQLLDEMTSRSEVLRLADRARV